MVKSLVQLLNYFVLDPDKIRQTKAQTPPSNKTTTFLSHTEKVDTARPGIQVEQ